MSPGELRDVPGNSGTLNHVALRSLDSPRQKHDHRWSIGTLNEKSKTVFYLGGPLSLLNGTCEAHANCEYFFARNMRFAIARKPLSPGDELTCCYNGSNPEQPMTHTNNVMICCNLLCRKYIQVF